MKGHLSSISIHMLHKVKLVVRSLVSLAIDAAKARPAVATGCIAAVLCLLLFDHYIFGSYAYILTDIGSDMFTSYYPFYYFRSTIIHEGFSFWNYRLGLGDSTLTPDLFDPFSAILHVFKPYYVANLLVYSILLKILFASITSTLVVSRLLPHAGTSLKIIGGLAYGFSGFFVLWGQHYFFSSAFAFLPLVLYGIERYIDNKNWIWFVIGICFSSHYLYTFAQVATFVVIYVLLRVPVKDYKTLCSLAFYGILGLGVMAFSSLPHYYDLSQSPRTQVTVDIFGGQYYNFFSFEYIKQAYLRLVSNNLEGGAFVYSGNYNYYELPQLYTLRVLTLCVPLAFFNRRYRILTTGLVVFLLTIFFVEFFSWYFNMFQTMTFRWGILFSAALLVVGVIGLFEIISNPSSRNKAILLVSFTLFILPLTIFIATGSTPSLDNGLAYAIIVMTFVQVVVLLLFKKNTWWMSFLVLLLVIVELRHEHYKTINERNAVPKTMESTFSSFFDAQKVSIKMLKERDTTFYRCDKFLTSGSLNDAYIQGYNGTSRYYSLNSKWVTGFYDHFEIPYENPGKTNYMSHFPGRKSFDDILSVKYIMARTYMDTVPEYTRGFTKIFTLEDANIYRRNNYLPLGFCYDSVITESQSRALPLATRDLSVVCAALVPDSFITVLPYVTTQQIEIDTRDSVSMSIQYQKRREDTVAFSTFTNDFFRGTIVASKQELLFLSIPINKGWTYTIDGQSVSPVVTFKGFSGFVLSPGKHVVEGRFMSHGFVAGMWCSVLSLLTIILLFVIQCRNRRKN